MGRVLRGWALAELGDARAGRARDHRAGWPPRAAPARAWTTRTTSALLAEAHLRAGEPTPGLAAVAEALELAQRERSLFYEPELHRLDGALHAVAGDAELAEACLRRGLARAREQGSAALELRIATDLARLLADPAGAAEARAARRRGVRALRGGLRHARPAQAAAAVLEPAAQPIVPAPASASTSTPSATR